MPGADDKDTLHGYLRTASDALLWKLDGVAEYDARRPLTPSGTNLLGLVKHLAVIELGYFGDTFGRPHGERLPWDGVDDDPNADMYAGAEETREDIVALYRRATAHADATIEALALDDLGRVPWWPDDANPVTLQRILVHVIAETHRHLGHADILREQVDGAIGHRPGMANVPDLDASGWDLHVQRVEQAARTATGLDPDAH